MLATIPSPSVDVVITTYNAVGFVQKALQSVLEQDGVHMNKIIIVDDASKDQTATIIQDYIQNSSVEIEFIRLSLNKGTFASFQEAISKTKAEYVAILEGDDTWTDVHKLSKQLYFLEQNKPYSGIGHRAKVVNRQGEFLDKFWGDPEDKEYTLTDLISVPPFQLSSLVFRRSAMPQLPEIFEDTISNDKVVNMALALTGSLYYSSEVMSSYRDHSEGIHRKTDVHRLFQAQLLFYSKASIFLTKKYDIHVNKALWTHLSGYLHACKEQRLKAHVSITTIVVFWISSQSFGMNQIRSLFYHLKLRLS